MYLLGRCTGTYDLGTNSSDYYRSRLGDYMYVHVTIRAVVQYTL